jgi:hypothetical protein
MGSLDIGESGSVSTDELFEAAGDLPVGTGDGTSGRLPAGTTGQVLTADTAEAKKMKWAAAAGGGGVTVQDRSTTQVDVVNTITETSLYSYSVPGNLLGTTGGLRLFVRGTHLNNSGSAANLAVKVKLGATTIFDTGNSSIGTAANRRQFWLVVTIMNTATNAQDCEMHGHLSVAAAPTTNAFWSDSTSYGRSPVGFGSTAEDTTTAKTLDVTITHGTAAATISFQKEMVVLELLPAS